MRLWLKRFFCIAPPPPNIYITVKEIIWQVGEAVRVISVKVIQSISNRYPGARCKSDVLQEKESIKAVINQKQLMNVGYSLKYVSDTKDFDSMLSKYK